MYIFEETESTLTQVVEWLDKKTTIAGHIQCNMNSWKMTWQFLIIYFLIPRVEEMIIKEWTILCSFGALEKVSRRKKLLLQPMTLRITSAHLSLLKTTQF